MITKTVGSILDDTIPLYICAASTHASRCMLMCACTSVRTVFVIRFVTMTIIIEAIIMAGIIAIASVVLLVIAVIVVVVVIGVMAAAASRISNRMLETMSNGVPH